MLCFVVVFFDTVYRRSTVPWKEWIITKVFLFLLNSLVMLFYAARAHGHGRRRRHVSGFIVKFCQHETVDYQLLELWQLRCIATWGRSTPRRSFNSPLQLRPFIDNPETPLPTCPFLSYSVFTADASRYPVTSTFHFFTLNMWSTLYKTVAKSSNPHRYFTLWPWPLDLELV